MQGVEFVYWGLVVLRVVSELSVTACLLHDLSYLPFSELVIFDRLLIIRAPIATFLARPPSIRVRLRIIY